MTAPFGAAQGRADALAAEQQARQQRDTQHSYRLSYMGPIDPVSVALDSLVRQAHGYQPGVPGTVEERAATIRNALGDRIANKKDHS